MQASPWRIKAIQSPQNPLIKRVVRLLKKKKDRTQDGVCIVEGLREVRRAFQCGYHIKNLYYRPDLLSISSITDLFHPYSLPSTTSHLQCSSSAFQKIAYRHDVANLIAEIEIQPHNLQTLSKLFTSHPKKKPLILGLDQIEKPGNLGAILRTASGLGVDGVLLCDAQVDLYHPNVIRNSLGGLFHLPIAVQHASRR